MRPLGSVRLLPRRPAFRTMILLAVVLDVPLLARLVCLVTEEPVSELHTIDGVPVEIVRPARRGAYPAFHFVTGAHPERRREPIVQRVANGFARAGFVAVVPDLPGLGEGELTAGTFDAAASVTEFVSERTDVRDGRVALAGASAGAGIALVVASRASLANRISVVAAVVPFFDVAQLLRLATTGRYGGAEGAPYTVTPLVRRVVARSLVATLPDGPEREQLRHSISHLGDDADACVHLHQAAAGLALGAPARAIVDLLGSADPHAYDLHFARLPSLAVEAVRVMSPVTTSDGVLAPVEVIAPPDDPYFPLPEAEATARGVANGRLTVTRVLDHTRPRLDLGHVADFARFLRWVHRCLAAAAS